MEGVYGDRVLDNPGLRDGLEPRPFRPEEVCMLEDISRPIGTAVANTRL
jgi:hypothetical protein